MIAFLFGKLFLFFFGLCALLDKDMAFGTIRAMVSVQDRIETQERYNEAIGKV